MQMWPVCSLGKGPSQGVLPGSLPAGRKASRALWEGARLCSECSGVETHLNEDREGLLFNFAGRGRED